MLRIILISIGLISCVHQDQIEKINNDLDNLSNKVAEIGNRPNQKPLDEQKILEGIDRLNNQMNYFDYETVNKFCFMIKDVCTASTNGVCISQYTDCLYDKDDKKACTEQAKTCIDQYQDKCFKIHEKCIIDNYHKWKPYFDKQNEKAKGTQND